MATLTSKRLQFLALVAALVNVATGFVPGLAARQGSTGTASVSAASSTALKMANDEDLLRWARSSRSAEAGDNVVELVRPVGVVLAQDDATGNVYVETVAPNGNAARSGKVRKRKFE